MTKRVDTVETVVDVFNIAMDIQELYLKQGPFKQLSMSEMHVLEAVDKEASPSMSAVANHLNVTLGTLTTALKKIIALMSPLGCADCRYAKNFIEDIILTLQ